MAVIEKDGLYQYIDENGNIYILYPVTKLDNVSGTGKLVHLKDGTTLQTLDGTNIAFVTADDLADFATKEDVETANAADRVKYESGVLKTLGGTEIVTGNARIATGLYVGTGTYGENNPNSLTFDFEPKMLFIYCVANDSSAPMACQFWLAHVSNEYQSIKFENIAQFSSMKMKFSSDRKTLYWYNTNSAASQFNELKSYFSDYIYVAIG